MKKIRLFIAVTLLLCLVSCAVKTPTDTKISQPLSEGSGFEIHFIDVGQADAALVLCDGKSMLIDAGNTGDSSRMYTYLKKHSISYLDYVIGTHAHEDHIGGMAGALSYAKPGTVYCPVTSYDSDAFRSFVKYTELGGSSISIPTVGEAFSLGSAEVIIVGCNSNDDTNNSSIVLKITYGETSFLFTGDAEWEAEQAVLDSNADISSTVLKVGHHGSNTSTGYRFLREVMPEYAVISVGKGNEYGHPHDEPLSRLRDADVTVYRTDLLGDIICKSDGKSVSFTFGTQGEENVILDESEYVLNTNSMKFHYPHCSNADRIDGKNKEAYSGTRDDLIKMGYTPGGCCKP